jgi:hypothetical protein
MIFARHLLAASAAGHAMSLGAGQRRWALFAVWDGEPALDGFLDRPAIAARWCAKAEEAWHVRLAPMASRGLWGGRIPSFGVGEWPPEARARGTAATRCATGAAAERAAHGPVTGRLPGSGLRPASRR